MVDVGLGPSLSGVSSGSVVDFADAGAGIFGTQAVGHSHFIEIGVADVEGEQAAVLILPAEAGRCVIVRGIPEQELLTASAMDSAFTDFDLVLSDMPRACYRRWLR